MTTTIATYDVEKDFAKAGAKSVTLTKDQASEIAFQNDIAGQVEVVATSGKDVILNVYKKTSNPAYESYQYEKTEVTPLKTVVAVVTKTVAGEPGSYTVNSNPATDAEKAFIADGTLKMGTNYQVTTTVYKYNGSDWNTQVGEADVKYQTASISSSTTYSTSTQKLFYSSEETDYTIKNGDAVVAAAADQSAAEAAYTVAKPYQKYVNGEKSGEAQSADFGSKPADNGQAAEILALNAKGEKQTIGTIVLKNAASADLGTASLAITDKAGNIYPNLLSTTFTASYAESSKTYTGYNLKDRAVNTDADETFKLGTGADTITFDFGDAANELNATIGKDTVYASEGESLTLDFDNIGTYNALTKKIETTTLLGNKVSRTTEAHLVGDDVVLTINETQKQTYTYSKDVAAVTKIDTTNIQKTETVLANQTVSFSDAYLVTKTAEGVYSLKIGTADAVTGLSGDNLKTTYHFTDTEVTAVAALAVDGNKTYYLKTTAEHLKDGEEYKTEAVHSATAWVDANTPVADKTGNVVIVSNKTSAEGGYVQASVTFNNGGSAAATAYVRTLTEATRKGDNSDWNTPGVGVPEASASEEPEFKTFYKTVITHTARGVSEYDGAETHDAATYKDTFAAAENGATTYTQHILVNGNESATKDITSEVVGGSYTYVTVETPVDQKLGEMTFKGYNKSNVVGSTGSIMVGSTALLDLVPDEELVVKANAKNVFNGTWKNETATSASVVADTFKMGSGADVVTFGGNFGNDTVELTKGALTRLNFDTAATLTYSLAKNGKDVVITAKEDGLTYHKTTTEIINKGTAESPNYAYKNVQYDYDFENSKWVEGAALADTAIGATLPEGKKLGDKTLLVETKKGAVVVATSDKELGAYVANVTNTVTIKNFAASDLDATLLINGNNVNTNNIYSQAGFAEIFNKDASDVVKGKITTKGLNDVINVSNYVSASSKGVTINSGAGADTITGSLYNDTIKGGAGHKTITENGGKNKITLAKDGSAITLAGDSTNTITAKGGNNVVNVNSAGTNKMTFGAGNDTVTIGATHAAGINTIKAGNGDNTLDVQKMSNNTFTGGKGVDTVTLGAGFNNVKTGAGNDIATVTGGYNTLDLGAGDDRITFTAAAADDLTALVNGGKGNDSYDVSGVAQGAGYKNIVITDTKGSNSVTLSKAAGDANYTNDFNVYYNVAIKTNKAGKITKTTASKEMLFTKQVGAGTDNIVTGAGIKFNGTVSNVYIENAKCDFNVKELTAAVANWLSASGYKSTDAVFLAGTADAKTQLTNIYQGNAYYNLDANGAATGGPKAAVAIFTASV